MDKKSRRFNAIPKAFPCFLCGEFNVINIDKNKKPYLVCNFCGIQSFIRGPNGINKLIELNKDPNFNQAVLNLDVLSNSALLRIKERIELLKDKIETLKAPISFDDKDLKLANVLKANIKALEDEYLDILRS